MAGSWPVSASLASARAGDMWKRPWSRSSRRLRRFSPSRDIDSDRSESSPGRAKEASAQTGELSWPHPSQPSSWLRLLFLNRRQPIRRHVRRVEVAKHGSVGLLAFGLVPEDNLAGIAEL